MWLRKEDEIIGTVTVSPKQNEWDEYIFGKEEVSNSLYIHRFAVNRKYKERNRRMDVTVDRRECTT